MNIFENLENLNVSEECFNEVIGIIEELLQDKKSERRNTELRAKKKQAEIKNLVKQREDAPEKDKPQISNQITKTMVDAQNLRRKAGKIQREVDKIAGK